MLDASIPQTRRSSTISDRFRAALEPPTPPAAASADKAALGVYGLPPRLVEELPDNLDKIQQNKSLRVYTPEERERWKQAKQRENCRKAHIARRWIAELSRGKRRMPSICQCGLAIKGGMGRLCVTQDGHTYHERQRCRSWACPVCAPTLAWRRALEIEKAILSAARAGYHQLFLTFTVPHTRFQKTRTVLKHLGDAYRAMGRNYAYQQSMEALGYVGQIKSVDFTYTDNGCHAHYHVIYIFDTEQPLEEVAARCYASVFKVWDAVVYKVAKRHISRHHGFNLEMIEIPEGDDEQAETIAIYTAKVISLYAAAADKDKGSLTPFDLLDPDREDEFKPIWQDYYIGSKGVRRLIFSRGLKELLGVNSHDTGDWERPEQYGLAYISPEHIYLLRDEKNRQIVEDLIKQHRAADALNWLKLLDPAPVLASPDLVRAIDSGQDLAEVVAALMADANNFVDDELQHSKSDINGGYEFIELSG